MIKHVKKNVEQEVPVTVICNKSGKEVDLTDDMNYVEQNLIHNFMVNFGYGSDFDMETWEFDLDESALLEIVKKFTHRPKGFAEDAKYPEAVFQEWKSSGHINWKAGWSDEDFEQFRINVQEQENRVEKIKGLIKLYSKKSN